MHLRKSVAVCPIKLLGVTTEQFIVNSRHTAAFQNFSAMAGKYELAPVKAYQFRQLGDYSGDMQVVEVVFTIDSLVEPAGSGLGAAPVRLCYGTAKFLWQIAFRGRFQSGFTDCLNHHREKIDDRRSVNSLRLCVELHQLR